MEKKFYLTLVNLLKQGKNPSSISKELNISKQKLNYYLRQLKKEGVLIKKGYGTWEVKDLALNTLTINKEIRGHAFIWSIRVPKEIQGLKERALSIGKRIGQGQIQLIIKNKKVWIGNETITIYEHLSFYGKNSIESRKYAVISLIEVLEVLERELSINLKPYVIKPKREHYGQIKNDLAIQCNRNNEKIIIRDNLEGEWLWIDGSLGIGELETGGTKALVRSKQVQDWWNDNKKHDFKVTPTFTMEAINKLTTAIAQSQIQLQKYEQQNVKHLKLIEEYRRENKAWRKAFEKKLITDTKEQRSLFEF